MTSPHKEALEKEITELSDALAHLGRGTTLGELIKIVRKPWFTTEAELAFLKAMLNAMRTQISAIEALQKEMLSASEAVRE